jgi:hypothetical protein
MNASHMVNPTPLRTALSSPLQAALPFSSRRRKASHSFASLRFAHSQSPSMAIESVAYAGVDMPVHLVLNRGGSESPSAQRSLLILDYPSFSRLLRERAPRLGAISVLNALGAGSTHDAASNCRNWVQVQVNKVIGSSLALSAAPSSQPQSTQTIAA